MSGKSYTHGPGIDNILAMQVYGETETNTYYYLKDHLGSVIGITDESGDLVESYTYDAWGNITVYDATGTEILESAIGNRYTFQGREISWATGLYYFRARWYDASVGRFLSKDPIGISGGLNQYVFCKNNPVNFRDPTGLCPEDGDDDGGFFDDLFDWNYTDPTNHDFPPGEDYFKDREWMIDLAGLPFGGYYSTLVNIIKTSEGETPAWWDWLIDLIPWPGVGI